MKSATLLASLFSFAWAAVTLAADRPSASQTVSVAGSQPAAKGPAEYFTGNVRVDPLFAAKDTAPFSGAYVTFEPGARSAWHTRPAGQHLIITSGVGWTQAWGGPVTEKPFSKSVVRLTSPDTRMMPSINVEGPTSSMTSMCSRRRSARRGGGTWSSIPY